MSLITLMKKVDAEKAGFHVLTDEELNTIHSILSAALYDISNVCRSHNIEWSLFGGSTLGAVRHKGFIPWDDDIDLFMTRQNFNKFKEVFHNTLSEKYELKMPGDEGYLMHYPQIYIKGTVAQLIQSTGKSEDRLFIDLFIMESTSDNKFFRYLHGTLCNAFLFVVSALRTDLCSENLIKCDDGTGMMIKEVNKRKTIAKFFKFRPIEKWLHKADKVFSLYKKEKRYVACPSGSLHFFAETYPRDKMCDLIEVPFENHTALIQKDYDYYLRKRYGDDYMTPPSDADQEKHVYVRLLLSDN